MSNRVPLQEKLAKLPVRARCAVALDCAGRCGKALLPWPRAHQAIADATAVAWSWVRGAHVPAWDIYNHIARLYDAERDLEGRTDLQSTLNAAISALYYATLQARRLERARGVMSPTLPEDMAEVDESELFHCFEYAREGLPGPSEEQRWAEQVQHLQQKCGSLPPDSFVICPAD